MTKVLACAFGVLFLVFWTPAMAAVAQVNLYSSIDVPILNEPGYAHVTPETFYVAGWALTCETGQRPDNVVVWMDRLTIIPPGGDSKWEPDYLTVSPATRPDVAEVFAGICPLVTPLTTGYGITPSSQPPVGIWQLHVAWFNNGGSEVTEQTRLVEITY